MQENTEPEKPEGSNNPEEAEPNSDANFENDLSDSPDVAPQFEGHDGEALPPEKKKTGGFGFLILLILLFTGGGGYLYYAGQVPPKIMQWAEPLLNKLNLLSTKATPSPRPSKKRASEAEEETPLPVIGEETPPGEATDEIAPPISKGRKHISGSEPVAEATEEPKEAPEEPASIAVAPPEPAPAPIADPEPTPPSHVEKPSQKTIEEPLLPVIGEETPPRETADEIAPSISKGRKHISGSEPAAEATEEPKEAPKEPASIAVAPPEPAPAPIADPEPTPPPHVEKPSQKIIEEPLLPVIGEETPPGETADEIAPSISKGRKHISGSEPAAEATEEPKEAPEEPASIAVVAPPESAPAPIADPEPTPPSHVEKPSQKTIEETPQQKETGRSEAVQAYLDFFEASLVKIEELIKTEFTKLKGIFLELLNRI